MIAGSGRRFVYRLPCLALWIGLGAGGTFLQTGCASNPTDKAERRLFRQVRPPVAFELIRDSPGMPIIDLRSPEEFVGPLGHLARARNIPLDQLEERRAEIEAIKGQTFLIYCQGGECGAEAMALLAEHGCRHAILMDGGIEAWLADGFGTVERAVVKEPPDRHPD